MPKPKRFLFLGSLPHVHTRPHVALHAVPRAQQVWDAPARRSAEPADIASALPRQRENWGWLLGNPTLQASTSSPHWPQAAAFEALLLWREKHRASPPRWRPQAHTSCSNAAGERAGREGRKEGTWRRARRTHLAAADAHATVVELQLVEGEAGGALEQGLKASHPIRPEGVVAQVQLHQLRPGGDESLS